MSLMLYALNRHASVRLLALAALGACGAARAQGLPTIFAETPRELHSVRTLAEFPKMTFLENLVVDGRHIVFTSHEDGKLYKLLPGGKPTLLASVPGKITGIATMGQGGFLLTAFDPAGTAVVHELDAKGLLRATTPLDGAVFLNGIEKLKAGRYLIADSYKGVVWQFDAKTRQSRVWLASPLLERADDKNPIPAANGVRRRGNEVLITNTAKMLLIRVPLQADGSAGEPSVLKEKINIDDFAVARDGSLWAATHIYNSVVHIETTGRVSVVAEAPQGLAGSTSVALSPDGKTAYVTTNGGMFLPPPEGVQVARLVAVSVAKPGR